MVKYEKEIHELAKAVGKKADRAEIEAEFLKYVDEFKISVDEAKRSIARKYEIPLGDSFEAVEKTLGEIEPGENNVTVLCRVVFATKKDVNIKGEEKTIISGILGDNTKTMPFTVLPAGKCPGQRTKAGTR